MILDLHVHSRYSKDSLMSPELILKAAKKRGLDGIAVTDHNTIKGGLETKKANMDKDFKVIVGSEIRTEYGDIIGLGLTDEILSSDFNEVVDSIKSQGGYVVLPHPFRNKALIPLKNIDKIDMIEVFNARSSYIQNKMALVLAHRFNKPISAGSDAHLAFEIGSGRVILDDSGNKPGDYQTGRLFEGKVSNYYLVHGLSLIIENIKKSRKLSL